MLEAFFVVACGIMGLRQSSPYCNAYAYPDMGIDRDVVQGVPLSRPRLPPQLYLHPLFGVCLVRLPQGGSIQLPIWHQHCTRLIRHELSSLLFVEWRQHTSRHQPPVSCTIQTGVAYICIGALLSSEVFPHQRCILSLYGDDVGQPSNTVLDEASVSLWESSPRSTLRRSSTLRMTARRACCRNHSTVHGKKRSRGCR